MFDERREEPGVSTTEFFDHTEGASELATVENDICRLRSAMLYLSASVIDGRAAGRETAVCARRVAMRGRRCGWEPEIAY